MMRIRSVVPVAVVLALVAVSSFAAELPISQVVLFSSGVGHFQRAGTIQGNCSVDLSFRVDQINDLLKSMTLQDLSGGKIGPVTYAPQDPLSHTLRSFAVDVVGNESLAELLYSLLGAKVSIVTADGPVAGTIMGVEEQEKSVGENVVTYEVLNLLTDKGIVQVPVWHMKSVTLTEEKLSSDLQKALAAIAASRDLDKRTVSVSFLGQGSRQVRVGYLLETPVWKTSYRLLAGGDKLFIQGWAIVENTTDDDWKGVSLALVSGQPISFIENLYEPLYVDRPVVEPQIAATTRPQMYEGAFESKEPAKPVAMAPAPPAPGTAGARRAEAAADRAAGAELAYAMLGRGGLAEAGVEAAVGAGKVGELFQYAIDQPVSIARQQSAMIPIINQDIAGQKVSIYNASVNSKHPLNGLKVKNSTSLHLMGGPITVFDGGVYAGDALINDVPPGDERLLSYAVDLAVRVDSESESRPDQTSLALKISHGVLTVTSKQVSEQTYTLKNVGAEARTVIVEHPLRDGWKLVAPKQAAERTADVYRFEVPVEAGKSAKLTVSEELPMSHTVALTDANADRVAVFVRAPKISNEMKAALQKILEMKTAIAGIQQQIDEHEDRLEEIGEEQARIRQNMEQLDHESELYKSYVQKFAAQEKEFETIQAEIKKLKADLTAKQKQSQDYIMGL